jgi:hypothetical protein
LRKQNATDEINIAIERSVPIPNHIILEGITGTSSIISIVMMSRMSNPMMVKSNSKTKSKHNSNAKTVTPERADQMKIERLRRQEPAPGMDDMSYDDEFTPQQQLQDTPVEEFLFHFREHGSECICTAYLLMPRPLHCNQFSGALSTSLPEDVFSLVSAQTSLLDEYLISSHTLDTEVGDSVLMDGLLSIIRNLWYKQTHFRNTFLTSLESCIAAANDFLRMIEKVDDLLYSMAKRYPHLEWEGPKLDVTTWVLRREAADLISLFGSDAVYAAQRTSTFIFQTIQQSDIKQDLFGKEWEDKLVHNQVAVSMVKTFEDYLADIHNSMDQDFLYHKAVVALVRSTVCFYLQCFIQKADQVRRAKRKLGPGKKAAVEQYQFMSTTRAICRMTYDIETLRDYFYNLAKDNTPLARVVANELSVLPVILECMWLAVGQTGDSLDEFIVVVHKRTGADFNVTKHFLSDIWLLMAPSDQQHVIADAVRLMTAELDMVSKRMQEKDAASPWKLSLGNSTNSNSKADPMVGLKLQDMLQTMYQDRILQERASVCGNLINNVRDLREREPRDPFTPTPQTQTPAQDLESLHQKFKNTLKLDHFRQYLGDKKEAQHYAGRAL